MSAPRLRRDPLRTGPPSGQLPLCQIQRRAEDLVHIIITVAAEPSAEKDVLFLLRKRLVFFIQRRRSPDNKARPRASISPDIPW